MIPTGSTRRDVVTITLVLLAAVLFVLALWRFGA